MNNKLISKSIAVLVIAIMAACSSDDPPPPPPLDCSATGPSLTLTETMSDCGEDNGEIGVNIVGGTGNITVTIDPQPIGFEFANNTFTSMEPGSYTVEVTDADNCTSSASATVAFTGTGLSYMTDVDPIVQARCAVTGCHVDGTGLPDFTVFANFQAVANNQPDKVRQRVKNDNMPASGGPLSAEEKAALFCWIDEGAMDN